MFAAARRQDFACSVCIAYTELTIGVIIAGVQFNVVKLSVIRILYVVLLLEV